MWEVMWEVVCRRYNIIIIGRQVDKRWRPDNTTRQSETDQERKEFGSTYLSFSLLLLLHLTFKFLDSIVVFLELLTLSV
jgi:hypothetical protein